MEEEEGGERGTKAAYLSRHLSLSPFARARRRPRFLRPRSPPARPLTTTGLSRERATFFF